MVIIKRAIFSEATTHFITAVTQIAAMIYDYDFWATVYKTVRPMLSDRSLSVLSCLYCLQTTVTLVYFGQTVGCINRKLGTQLGLGPGHTVLDWDAAPLPEKGAKPPPVFWITSERTYLRQQKVLNTSKF